MDGSAVNAIRDLAQEALSREVPGSNGVLYHTGKLTSMKQARDVVPISFRSLTGFASYVEDEFADDAVGEENEPVIVIVDGPTTVTAYGKLEGPFLDTRAKLATAHYHGPDPHSLLGWQPGDYMTHEATVLALQAVFTEDGERDDLLRVLSSMKLDESIESEDNGVSQTVKARKGVASTVEVAVKNPWTLHPRWSFTEIGQVAVEFVVRFYGDPARGIKVGLFQADGGQWETVAMAELRQWLRETFTSEMISVY